MADLTVSSAIDTFLQSLNQAGMQSTLGLGTWAGSANIVTVGTIATGTWQGTAIADAYIASASTWNGKISGNQTITLSGDTTGSGATAITVTVVKINGVALSGLATGILKNTTTTGVPSIAVAGDFPTLNQNTSGNAATATKLATARNINGVAFDGTAAVIVSALIFKFACSDLTTALAPATKVGFEPATVGGTITRVQADVLTAPTGTSLICDVKKNGTTILSTLLSIDAGETSSLTAATPAVVSVGSFSAGDQFTVDITQVGGTIAGAGLVVSLITSPNS